jgi:dolichol-phosphate mannosyltransferase
MHAQAINTGVDCVTGVRKKRRDVFLKRASSRIANGFRNWITGDQVTDSGCGIRVVRREALREIPIFNGTHRFLPTLLRAQGFTVAEYAVNHRERVRGVSKYGMHNRLWRGLRDCFGIRWYLKRAVPASRLKRSVG